MQTILLDDEIKLIDGIPYNIDFYQDFSTIRLDGHPITDMPIASIIKAINSPKVESKVYDAHVTYSAKGYQHSQEFGKQVDKFTEQEKTLEKEWKKGKKKRALDMEQLLSEIDSGEYFVKGKGGK
jgi:hypothetical protein